MERHTKIRKWIIYSGVFFLALSTVITIVSTSSKFSAQVATQPLCLPDGQTANLPDECNGSGGGTGGGTGEECIDPVPVGETSGNTSTAIPKKECACYDYPPFDEAHDGVTESTQQAGVSALNSKKPTLDSLWRQFINDAANPYFNQARVISNLLKGGDASAEQAAQLVAAIADGVTKTWADPVYQAKIKLGVVDPAAAVAKAVYDASTLPKELKHAEGDSTTIPDKKRSIQILSGFSPSFTGFPKNFRLKGFDVELLNYTESAGDFEACLSLKLETANGLHKASVEGIKLYGEMKFGDRWGGFAGASGNAKGFSGAQAGLLIRF